MGVVIDLHEQGEKAFERSAVASEEGLEYHRVLVPGIRFFSADVFAGGDPAGDRLVFVH